MRISGQLPMNIARAYGVNPAQSMPAVARPGAAGESGAVQSVAGVRSTQPANPLIAAKVAGGVSFESASRVAGPSLQLYTRAADKVEASVAVNVGRAIDVRG